MTKPKVDIIMPFHQQTHMLKEAISSAQESTMGSVRIIAINDSGLAVDKSELGLREVDLLENSNTKGYQGALATGMQLSTAEFITFLDSDDILDKEKIFRQVIALETDQANLATGEILRFDRSIHRTFQSPLSSDLISRMSQIEKSIFGAYGADSTLMFRASQLKETWGIHSSFPSRLSDFGWLLSVLPSTKIIHCKSAIYYYRTHQGQMSRVGDLRSEWLALHPLWTSNLKTFLGESSVRFPEIASSVSQAIAFPTSLPRLDRVDKIELTSLLKAIADKLHTIYPEESKSINFLIGIRLAIANRGLNPKYLGYSILLVFRFFYSFNLGNRMRRQ
jgi:glycosyltransferase involved in cell wall biosynthesis